MTEMYLKIEKLYVANRKPKIWYNKINLQIASGPTQILFVWFVCLEKNPKVPPANLWFGKQKQTGYALLDELHQRRRKSYGWCPPSMPGGMEKKWLLDAR